MKVFDQLPPASPRIGFFKAVAGWKDAALVEFGPEGTMHYAQGSIKGDTSNLYTTGMLERQIIFGDTSALESAVRDIDKNVHPKLLFVTSSPVSEIIGADLDAVVFALRPEVSAQLSVWDRVPVEGTQSQGESAAYARAAKFLESVPAGEKRGFVILGLNESDFNGVADLGELRRMVETYFALPCLNDPDGRYRLTDLADAQCLLCASPESTLLAKKAQSLWKTPWLESLPCGVRGCEAFVGALEAALGRRANPVWRRERAEAQRISAQLRECLKGLPDLRFFVDARPARCNAWTAFLSEELGAAVARPGAASSALSTDGGLGELAEIRFGDFILASGLLCSSYPRHASLCIEYPVAQQKFLSRYIPLMGIRGIENFAFLLHGRLNQVL